VIIDGRSISKGKASGRVLLAKEPVSFLGGVDPAEGVLKEGGVHRSVKNEVMAFPRGRGSTVGSYVIYEMKRVGTLPKAIINTAAEPIVATGAVMASVPMVDGIDMSLLRDGDYVTVDADKGTVELHDVTPRKAVTCLVRKDDKVLFLKREPNASANAGEWGGVSVKARPDEEPEDAARREVFNQLGADRFPVLKAPGVLVRDGYTMWELDAFLFELSPGRIDIGRLYDAYKWAAPKDAPAPTVDGLDKVMRALKLL